jgi:hypothetical protein
MVNIDAEKLKKKIQGLENQTIITSQGNVREPSLAEKLGFGFKFAIEEAKRKKERKLQKN